MPAAFADRLARGTALNRILTKVGEGAAEGWGAPEDMSANTEKFWRDIGVFNDPTKGQASPVRLVSEAVMRPLSAAWNLTGAAAGAGVTGLGALAGAIAEEMGEDRGSAGRLARDVRMTAEMALVGTMFRGHVARPEIGRTGGHDVTIGTGPARQDFFDASRVVANDAAVERVRDKLERLWDENGIHPAEVAADAARDATITQDLLSAGPELPRAYVGRDRQAAGRAGEAVGEEAVPASPFSPNEFRVAAKAGNGQIHIGESGWIHSDLIEHDMFGEMGFVDRAGNFYTSTEALARLDASVLRRTTALEPLEDISLRRIQETERLEARALRAMQRIPDPAPVEAIAADVSRPELRQYRPGELRVDARRFQFKEGGDTEGVTPRLADVETWDPIKAGMTVVYEDAEGVPYIVDGHQRLGLARRIAEADPAQDPRLTSWVLREADGITEAEARAVAAAKNIAEGTGTPVDAAKMLRDRPDLLPSLPPRSELVRQAQGLMALDAEAFGKVVNEVVPPNYAAIVGRLAPADAKLQNALIDLLHKTQPDNVVQAEAIVRAGLDAGLHVDTQATLFGQQELVSSLYAERARVLDLALKALRRDRTVFQAIVDNRAIIEELGNTLAQDANLQRSAIDGRAVELLQVLANRRGRLSDSLTAVARGVADGSLTRAIATRDFIAEIRRQTAAGDIARIADGGTGVPVDAAGAVAADARGAGRTAESPGASGQRERGVRDVGPAEEARAARAADEVIYGPPADIPPGGYQTAKGSVYEVHDDGTTTRNKSFHPEHGAADQGLKSRSAKTIYVGSSAEAVNLSGAGLSGVGPDGFRLVLRDGKATLVWRNPNGQWGASASSRDIPFTTDPAVGKFPVEMWRAAEDVPGFTEVYAAQHAGNEIVAMEPRKTAVVERTDQGDQLVIPGAEQSARQAAAAREAEGQGRTTTDVPQQEPGGLFTNPEPPAEPGLFERLLRSEEGAVRLGAESPKLTPAEQAIRDSIAFDAKREGFSLARTWNRLYTLAVDRLHPIEEAIVASIGRRAEKGLPTAENPYEMARLLSGVPGKAEHWLKYGQVDFTTNRTIGPALRDILRPLEGDLERFDIFATSVRALELDRRGVETGKDIRAARQVAAVGLDRYGRPLAQLIQFQDNLTRYLRDSGVLSERGYEAMREANRLYVPFYRAFEDSPPGTVSGGSIQPQNPIHRIKGSERATEPALESIVMNTYHYLAMADRNAALTTLVDFLRDHSDAHAAIRDVSREHTGDGTVREAYRGPTPEGRAAPVLPAPARADLFPDRGPVPAEEPLARAAPTVTEEGVAQAVRELLDHYGLSDDLFDFVANAAPPKVGEIRIFRDGKAENWQIGQDVAEAVKALDNEAANTIIRWLSMPARALRAGATLTPEFMLRNPLRDFTSAVVQTTRGVFSPIDTARGLYSAVMKDEYFRDWLKSGGGNATMIALDRRYLQESLRDLNASTGLLERAWNVVRHPIDALRLVSEISEQATRVGEFRAVRDQALVEGMTPREAGLEGAYASREVTLDFARRGAKTQAMNMLTAFWNAQVQGVDRVARAFRDEPVETSLKVAAGITLPSVLLWWANHDDPRYRELPGWQRDLFWIVLTDKWEDSGEASGPAPQGLPYRVANGRTQVNKGAIWRIPKPFELGVLFGSGAERLLDQFFTDKPEALEGFGKSVIETLLPGVIPTAALPIVEQFANRSTFADRTLIPAPIEKLLPEYQYQPYTTETAKKLGQIIAAFPGIRDLSTGEEPGSGVARAMTTPILMENYLRAWTGGLGMYALQIADVGLRKSGILPDPPKPADTLADIPVVKAFAVRYPSASAESIQRFYDDYEKSKRYFDTWMAKAREGDVAAMARVAEAGGAQMFARLDAIKEVLAEHSKLVRDIWKDPEMPPTEKRQLIDQLYFSQIQIAQSGREAMREVGATRSVGPAP